MLFVIPAQGVAENLFVRFMNAGFELGLSGAGIAACINPASRSKSKARMTPDQFKSEMIALLPRLRRFALSLARSGPDADDLLQDACSAALQKWAQYDPAQPLDRWMFRIIRNLWINEIRKRKVRQGQGQVSAEDTTELRVEANAEIVMTARQVESQVADLEANLSQPLLLVCSEGYSYREASDLLGIPVGTVMSRIHRARKMLVSKLSIGEYAFE